MAMKHYAKPLGGGGMTFTWHAGYLSSGMNLKNPGKINLETITQNIGGQINIYGIDNPDLIANIGSTKLIGSFATTKVGYVKEIELDKSYPYIILWSIYNTNGWGADVRITV